MMNEPTKRATPAKTSSRMLKNDRLCWMSDWFSSVICSPVSTSTPSGMACCTRAASSSSEMEPSPLATMLSTIPGCPTKLSAVAVSNMANVAPPGESTSPNFTTPTRGNCRLPPWLDTETWSPSAKSPSLKLPMSTTSSSGPGRRPSASTHGDSSPP